MRNELANKTIAALKNISIEPEPSEPNYLALETYLASDLGNRDIESLDNRLREILYHLGAPLLGAFVSGTDLHKAANALFPCLNPELPLLSYRTVRTLKFLASVCEDAQLKQEVGERLAGFCTENGRQ